MELFNKASKTYKVSAEELAAIVAREFIGSADQNFLNKVEKTAKGGAAIMGAPKTLKTKDEKFILFVDKGPEFLIWLKHKDAFVCNLETKEKWELKSAKEWPKFYEAVKKYINVKRNK